MEEPNTFDSIRAWAEGGMGHEEAARLERRLADDPELGALAEEYRRVHTLTRVAEEVPMASYTTLADIERRLEEDARGTASAGPRRVSPRRVAAAAAVLLIVVGGLLLLRVLQGDGDDGWKTLRLQAIAPPPVDTADALAEAIPARLVDYRPVDDGTIRWLDSLDEGRRAARATGRPLMVFGMYPDCEECDLIRDTALKEQLVLAALEDFIPVEVDLSLLPPVEAFTMMKCGYPVLEVQAADGSVVTSFCGLEGAKDMANHLDEGWEIHTDTVEPLAWERTHALAGTLAEARALEAAGRLGEAHARFVALGAEAEGGAFRGTGEAGRRRVAQAAYDMVRRVLELPPAEVEAALGKAVRDFAGSPYEVDFLRLLESVRRRGALPEVTFSRP